MLQCKGIRLTSCTSSAMRDLNVLNRRLASRTSDSHSMYGRAGLLVRQYSSLNAAANSIPLSAITCYPVYGACSGEMQFLKKRALTTPGCITLSAFCLNSGEEAALHQWTAT